MTETGDVDMHAPRTFYDPHPGRAGAAVPIPAAIRRIAASLDGRTMPLKDAIEALEAPGIGTIGIVARYSYVSLRLGPAGGPGHLFRVIRYR